MNLTPATPGSVTAFLIIVGAVIAAFLAAVHHADRATTRHPLRQTMLVALSLGAWLGLLSGLVASGRMASLPFHGIPVFFGGVLVVSVLAGLSSLGGKLAATVPLGALVGFQAFRLPLELVLHRWTQLGTIPETMTWTGQNWDIVTGIVALFAAPLARRRRGVAWGANFVGVVLLLNVMRVAVMSSPLPFGWGQQPPLLLALHLPYALIGPVLVGGALFGHVVLTRALLRRD